MSEVRLITPITRQDAKKTQVAAYCRVSSNSADQLNSYAAQIRAYKKLIGERKEWELVDIFADEGLTGTKSETRDEFQRMIRMCELKRIDLIVTKSISRFARNTKDALAYVRKLKLLGVGVQFEKEGISTLSMGDEMLLNTFAALAQEESQAISMNQRLSIVKRMELGEYVDSNAPYGYRLVDKALAVYEPEAAIVRNIFTLYLRGFSTSEIARELNKLNIPTKAGKETWRPSRVAYILKNERYIGDSFYQKTYRETTVPFNQHTNRGQEDRFYAKDTHPAIIEKDVFDTVQKLIEKRKDAFSRTTTQNIYPLTSRIQCSECGSFYRRRIVSGTVKWVCAVHKDDSTACDSNYYSEERIYDGFITMVNKLRFSEDNILAQVINRLEMTLAAMKRNNLAARDLSKSIAELNAKLLTLPPSPHTSPSVNRAGSYFIPRQKRRSRWTMEVTKVPKKIVTVIEPKRSMTVDKEKYRQKRVAAYCRVSTDSEEQLVSYANQKKVYTEMIASRKDWCFAGLFADEGKSGTRADKRPEFNKMINDCLAGKIDYIITKSVSRFARNTVDCLDYVRMLKSKGIGIYFEEQQIDTLKTDSELYLVIYAGFAQSESESISKNITWSVRKKFGKFLFPLFGVRKMNYYFNM